MITFNDVWHHSKLYKPLLLINLPLITINLKTENINLIFLIIFLKYFIKLFDVLSSEVFNILFYLKTKLTQAELPMNL